jgi:hypothetical protein
MMNRKEFYETYRKVRFIFSAASNYAVKGSVVAPDYTMQYRIMDDLHESISYAVHNKHAQRHYPIADNKWAIKINSQS